MNAVEGARATYHYSVRRKARTVFVRPPKAKLFLERTFDGRLASFVGDYVEIGIPGSGVV